MTRGWPKGKPNPRNKGDRVKIQVRIPTFGHRRLKAKAASEGKTLTDWAIEKLTQAADKQEAESGGTI